MSLVGRFSRWAHQTWGIMCPWRWREGGPPCKAITEQTSWFFGPAVVWRRTHLVTCECGRVFWRRP